MIAGDHTRYDTYAIFNYRECTWRTDRDNAAFTLIPRTADSKDYVINKVPYSGTPNMFRMAGILGNTGQYHGTATAGGTLCGSKTSQTTINTNILFYFMCFTLIRSLQTHPALTFPIGLYCDRYNRTNGVFLGGPSWT